jgi:hypothetical protein
MFGHQVYFYAQAFVLCGGIQRKCFTDLVLLLLPKSTFHATKSQVTSRHSTVRYDRQNAQQLNGRIIIKRAGKKIGPTHSLGMISNEWPGYTGKQTRVVSSSPGQYFDDVVKFVGYLMKLKLECLFIHLV